jgi:hypothetical protein
MLHAEVRMREAMWDTRCHIGAAAVGDVRAAPRAWSPPRASPSGVGMGEAAHWHAPDTRRAAAGGGGGNPYLQDLTAQFLNSQRRTQADGEAMRVYSTHGFARPLVHRPSSAPVSKPRSASATGGGGAAAKVHGAVERARKQRAPIDWATVEVGAGDVPAAGGGGGGGPAADPLMQLEMAELCRAAADPVFLQHAFTTGVRELERLWADVHFPFKQRVRFAKMYLQEPSIAAYTHLRTQITKLCNYRLNLVRLIGAIAEREELLYSVQRRIDRLGSVERHAMLQLCQLTYVVSDRLKAWKKAYDFNDVFVYSSTDYEVKMARDAKQLAEFVKDF